jgi:hypothetical protein
MSVGGRTLPDHSRAAALVVTGYHPPDWYQAFCHGVFLLFDGIFFALPRNGPKEPLFRLDLSGLNYDDLVKSQNWDGKVKSSICKARKT